MTNAASPLIQNFSVAANTDQDIIITITTTLSGDTLEGATVYWKMYEQKYGLPTPGVDPVLEKSSPDDGIDILPSPPMTLRLRLTRADTASLLRNYYHEFTVVDAGGDYSDPTCGLVTITQSENRP